MDACELVQQHVRCRYGRTGCVKPRGVLMPMSSATIHVDETSGSLAGFSRASGPADTRADIVGQTEKPQLANSVRLYVLDGGKIDQVGSLEFGFQDGELSSEMFTPCFLIVHPKG